MELRARLSDRAARGWNSIRVREDVWLSSLVEALGREIAEGRWQPNQRQIRLAQRIKKEGASRKKQKRR